MTEEELSKLMSDMEGINVLKSKLSIFVEKAKSKQVEELEEIEFCEKTIKFTNEKIKKNIITSQQYEKDILQSESTSENKLKIYDKLFLCYNDILTEVKEDIKKNSINDNPSEDYMKNMRTTNSYIQYLLLSNTVERNFLILNNLIEKLNSKKTEISAIHSIIRIVDILIQNNNEIETLPDVEENDQILDKIYLNLIYLKSLRLFYVAENFKFYEFWAESFMLYSRGYEVSSKAKKDNSKISILTQNLSKQLKIQIVTLQSQKILKSLKANKKENDLKLEKVPILSNLNSFQIDKKTKPLLIVFPPDFEAIQPR
jgi:hypothetical protein